MTEPGREIVVAGIGEIVTLEDARACAKALLDIRVLEGQLREAKQVLTDAIVSECSRQGKKTLTLPSGAKAVVSGGTETVWDVETLEQLLTLGLPPERYGDLVTTEVTVKVNAREADRIAGANEQYAAVIEAAKTVVEKPQYVTIRSR